jgi:hypothetical protein
MLAAVDSGVEHRGDERVPQQVRVGAADAYAAGAREALAGGRTGRARGIQPVNRVS